MKILLTADIHYSLPQFDWLLGVAPLFDAMILAGDHLDIASHVDGRAQIVVVLKYLERIAKATRLLVCSGNHDLDSRDEHGEKVTRWLSLARHAGIPADGDAILINGTLFSIFPWWDGPKTQARITAQLARDCLRPRKSWVWVYHAPPEGTRTCREGAQSYGDPALPKWIAQYQPDFVLSGHVHNAPFTPEGSWIDRVGSTWVLNSGRQIGPAPTHIALNIAQNAAIWFSLAGPEIAALNCDIDYPLPKLREPPDWLALRAEAPGGARRELEGLVLHEVAQHLVDEAEVVDAVGKLQLDIGEVFGDQLQAQGQHLADVQHHARIGLHEGSAVPHGIDPARLARDHGRAVVPA